MLVNTNQRSSAPEIMDDFKLEGEILRDALDKIASINQLLGGNQVTLSGVGKLIANQDTKRTFTIIDIGCGNGDMLRALAQYAEKHQLKFKLIGIDANAFTVAHAEKLSTAYPNIHYECKDIFSNPIAACDIIICTLTLHHFKDDEILELIQNFNTLTRVGMVINDLHRNALAYYLFKALCFVFRLNEMSREDGLVSILRGFKKKDLQTYSSKLKLKSYSIKWKWAFRYQWIITKE